MCIHTLSTNIILKPYTNVLNRKAIKKPRAGSEHDYIPIGNDAHIGSMAQGASYRKHRSKHQRSDMVHPSLQLHCIIHLEPVGNDTLIANMV